MKTKERRLGIIGHFGGTEKFYDGQTIKTKELYEELTVQTGYEIICVDTYYKNRVFKLLFDYFKMLVQCRDIIVLLSRNGMKVFFPLLFLAQVFLKKRIFHLVIGGNLSELLDVNKAWKKYLNSFCVNWVESDWICERVRKKGISNVEVLPNFKHLELCTREEAVYRDKGAFRFCTFSRVMKEKGITDAVLAVKAAKEKTPKKLFIDIYGTVDKSYEKEFFILMEENKEFAKYRGIVEYNESTKVLKEYYALLFPTYWNGEGMPGTIIDAYASGLPVIATDWNCNAEFVSDRKTGIVYPNCRIQSLEEAILWAIDNKLDDFRRNCVARAMEYQPDKIVKKIIDRIEKYDC